MKWSRRIGRRPASPRIHFVLGKDGTVTGCRVSSYDAKNVWFERVRHWTVERR